MMTHIISGSLFNNWKHDHNNPYKYTKDSAVKNTKHCRELLETMEVVLKYVAGRLSGGEYNKAAKSSETMAFDCPLVCPEILEQLWAASSFVSGPTVQAKVTKTMFRLFS